LKASGTTGPHSRMVTAMESFVSLEYAVTLSAHEIQPCGCLS
jgi:hypothetical protein